MNHFVRWGFVGFMVGKFPCVAHDIINRLESPPSPPLRSVMEKGEKLEKH